MSIISVTDVRTAGGFPSDLATDTQIEHSLEVIEPLVERAMNTKFKPDIRIDVMTGNRDNFIYTDKNPLLRLENIRMDDIDLDIDGLSIFQESGKIQLTNKSNISLFVSKDRGLVIRYIYGFLIKDDNKRSSTTADVSPADSIDVDVISSADFEVGDWVTIEGLDGNIESAKIISIVGDVLTLDKLCMSHESGSLVTKLIIPQFIKRFIELEAVIYLALNAIGATYVFNASYSLGDLNVTKGVPYTHWRESLEKAIKERESLRGLIKPRFKIL